MKEPPLKYDELLKLVSYGIFAMRFKGISVNDENLEKCDKIKNAVYDGIYVGSPGKDIYYMLPHLDDNKTEEIADKIAEKFPKIPPGNHVNVGAFVRFVYGQFEKQGILRSEKDFQRMKREKIEWELSRKFLKLLYGKLEKINNFYGMSILCEMNAHRLGDEAVIGKSSSRLEEMEKMYKKSVRYAFKCNSYKQLFTPYYWAYKYYSKFKKTAKALSYAYMTVEAAEKYCPDARPGYIEKILDCMGYIKRHDKKSWKLLYQNYKNNSKNKCIKNYMMV